MLRRLDGPLDDTAPGRRPVTVRDLLTFRGGFGMILAPPDQYPVLAAEQALELRSAGPPTPVTPYRPDEWMRRAPVSPDAGGGLVSTAGDYLAFGQMLLAGGRHQGERIVPPELVAAMTTDQLTAKQRETGGLILGGRGWGFGLSVIDVPESGGRGPTGYGWSGGFGTVWVNDPR